jgi:cytochrome P450 family 142 subfamily A polypeptide 1
VDSNAPAAPADPTAPAAPAALDLNDPRLYDDPWDFYRWLRSEAPVWWNEASGMYAISRHEDVSAISRNPALYSAAGGVRPLVPVPMSIISMDDPEHTRQRRLISKGFTPMRVRALTERIRELSNEVIDDIQGRGRIEFVKDFAIHVPLVVIAELMGLDPAMRDRLYGWSDAMMDGDGHFEAGDPVLERAAVAFMEYTDNCRSLIDERRTKPRDDIISVLTAAYDDGDLAWSEEARALHRTDDELTNDELLMFCALLVVAGNETTRNAISGGLRAFSLFPDQQEKLIANPDLIDSAVEEIVRWTTPVLSFMRTVTEDHQLHGVDLHAGDRVMLLYQSANRDERVFADPDDFVIDRNPNPHMGFGTGPHYCLGANLARLEVAVVFSELFRRLPDIRAAAPTDPLSRSDSSLVLGIRELPAIFTPC